MKAPDRGLTMEKSAPRASRKVARTESLDG